MLKSTFEFRDGKLAKFEYIKKAFELDKKKFIDILFDSMNGSTLKSPTGKKYKCGVTDESPHF